MKLDRMFILTALIYLGTGMILGEHMGRTQDHGQMPTHAHIMLVGWVSMALYGVLYRLWPSMQQGRLPWIQFGLHQIGSLVMFIGLFLLYGGTTDEATIGPVLGIAAGLIVLAWAIFFWLFATRSGKPRSA